MKMIKSNSGLSLIELIIALSLLSVVLAIGYNLYHFGTQSFQRGQDSANVQREIRMAADYISSELRLAREVAFREVSDPLELENDQFYFFEDNGSIIHRYLDVDGDVVDRVLLDQDLDGIAYTFKVKKAEGETGALEDVIYFEVITDLYQVDTSVIALNLPDDFEIEEESIDSVYYVRKDFEPEESAPANGNGDDCFIATAAYGSDTTATVIILRDFRDKHLLTSPAGKVFVAFYYEHAPALSSLLSQNTILLTAVRLLLYPLVAFIYAIMHFPIFFTVLLLAALLLLFWKKVFLRRGIV